MLISVYSCIVNFLVTHHSLLTTDSLSRNNLLEVWTFFIHCFIHSIWQNVFIPRARSWLYFIQHKVLYHSNICILLYHTARWEFEPWSSIPLTGGGDSYMPLFSSLHSSASDLRFVLHWVFISVILKFGSVEPVCSNCLTAFPSFCS